MKNKIIESNNNNKSEVSEMNSLLLEMKNNLQIERNKINEINNILNLEKEKCDELTIQNNNFNKNYNNILHSKSCLEVLFLFLFYFLQNEKRNLENEINLLKKNNNKLQIEIDNKTNEINNLIM